MRNSGLAMILLAVGATRHYGWALADAPMRGLASKALGAVAILCLLWIVYSLSRAAALVLLWWAWEELQVILCSTWFAFDPWPVAQGEAMCSAKLGFDLGALGVLFISLLLLRLSRCQVLQVAPEAQERKE